MIVRLTKLSSNPNPTVDASGFREGKLGWLNHEPQIGKTVVLYYADGKMDSAYMYTSPVKRITYQEDTWIVDTLNSTYQIDKIPDNATKEAQAS